MNPLFTSVELATYLQRTTTGTAALSADVAALALALVTDVVRGAVGASVYDPTVDPPPGVKWLALDLAARIVTNPEGLVSSTVGAVTDRYRTETVATLAEQESLQRAFDAGRPDTTDRGDVCFVSLAG